MRRIWFTAVGAAGLLAMAGCGAGTGYGASGGSPSPAHGSTAVALSTSASPVGQIVVTSSGRAVYEFDKDTAGSGTSACTGTCAALWPAVTTTSGTPTVSGVTGTLGTLTRSDGSTQVTVDGHPLYTYSGDSGAGQIHGQSFMNLWWVVAPSGAKITKSASSSSSAPSSAGGGYSY